MTSYGMSAILALSLACLCLLGATVEAGAEEVKFSNIISHRGVELKLRGSGVLRYLFFDVYAGALYLPDNVSPEQALEDIPKRLEVEYLRPIAGEDFGEATIRGIRQNVDKVAFERLRPKIDYHNSLYRSVKAGDRYALSYVPGFGTDLTLNGVFQGKIEGADFASALFAIWLGPNPVDETFKQYLLGEK